MFVESLPLLIDFKLFIYRYFTPAHLSDERLIRTFSGPFWMAKEHFHIVCGIAHWTNYRNFLLFSYPIERKSLNSWSLNIHWNLPSKITRLIVRQHFPIPSCSMKLTSLQYLHLEYLNESLFQWIDHLIDLSRIVRFDCRNIRTNIPWIIFLLIQMRNLNNLIVNFNQLIDLKQSIKSVRKLNISSEIHSFEENDILFLSNVFPSIEHLQINPKNFHHVHLLKNSFANLLTLTLPINENAETFRRIWLVEKTFDDWKWFFRVKVQLLGKMKYLRKRFHRS